MPDKLIISFIGGSISAGGIFAIGAAVLIVALLAYLRRALIENNSST